MSIFIIVKWTWVQIPSVPLKICIRGRVVEGTGLIIRFPLERHWFKSSRMHFIFLIFILFFKTYNSIIQTT